VSFVDSECLRWCVINPNKEHKPDCKCSKKLVAEEPFAPIFALTIKPGKFYISRSGDVWCCYHAVKDAPPNAHAAVYCIRAEYPHSGVEYFYANGSYTGKEEHRHDLIREAPEGAGYV
jgi:hypothetical protein